MDGDDGLRCGISLLPQAGKKSRNGRYHALACGSSFFGCCCILMKRSFLFLVLVVGGIIISGVVFGQASSIGISPLTFEFTGNPGEVFENYLKVYNPSSDNAIGIKMTVEDIAPSGEQGFVVVEPAETESYSLARWIKTEPEEFDLNPGEEKLVKFAIAIPENAEPGGHYGTVVAGIKVSSGPGITGAAIIQRIGALVLLTIPGEMEENLAVKEFSAPRYSEYGPVPFVVKFENTGTVHTKPSALVSITDWRGKKIAVLDFPSRNVLPTAVRKFEASFDKKWLLGGKYTATLTGSYGSSNFLLIPQVITFWVFPWKVGLAGLFLLLLFILTRRRWLAAFRILIKGEK